MRESRNGGNAEGSELSSALFCFSPDYSVNETNKPFSRLCSVCLTEQGRRQSGRRKRKSENRWEGSIHPTKPKVPFKNNQAVIILGAHLEFKNSVFVHLFVLRASGPT